MKKILFLTLVVLASAQLIAKAPPKMKKEICGLSKGGRFKENGLYGKALYQWAIGVEKGSNLYGVASKLAIVTNEQTPIGKAALPILIENTCYPALDSICDNAKGVCSKAQNATLILQKMMCPGNLLRMLKTLKLSGLSVLGTVDVGSIVGTVLSDQATFVLLAGEMQRQMLKNPNLAKYMNNDLDPATCQGTDWQAIADEWDISVTEAKEMFAE